MSKITREPTLGPWRLAYWNGDDSQMGDYTAELSPPFLTMEEDLRREFDHRIRDSSNLAFRVAYGVLRNREDAEDVTQDAFASAYRNFTKLRDHERFRAWLVRITWRMAIDHQRTCKRRMLRDGSHAAVNPAVTAAAPEPDRTRRLWDAIDALPEKLRVVTVLAGIEEHDIREVAKLLDLPEGTVKSRLFKARQRMKEFLQ
jgi:RNA polymerase sigma-70 factor (ECF subfamily)